MVENSWETVIDECGIEDVAMAQRLFANLKKRFNRRRKDNKESGRYGSSTNAVSDAKEKLKELAFLTWLEPYVRRKQTVRPTRRFTKR